MKKKLSKKASEKKMKASEKKMKPLPKTFRGADVMRGVGMNADAFDLFLEKKALDSFDATREMWIVLEDDALEDLDNVVEVKGFADKDEAVRYAQARSNGNVNHRVLRVTDQVLVIATRNEL